MLDTLHQNQFRAVKRSVALCIAVQCCAVQSSIVQYSTLLLSTMKQNVFWPFVSAKINTSTMQGNCDSRGLDQCSPLLACGSQLSVSSPSTSFSSHNHTSGLKRGTGQDRTVRNSMGQVTRAISAIITGYSARACHDLWNTEHVTEVSNLYNPRAVSTTTYRLSLCSLFLILILSVKKTNPD